MPADISADAAGTWKLGDFSINRLGFGAMRITANPDRDLAIRVLRRAVELGVNHIDTAAFYRSPGGTLGVGEGSVRYANELSVSEQQIRLAWTLHQGPNVLAIPGTGNPTHLEQNIAAGALKFTADELATLA